MNSEQVLHFSRIRLALREGGVDFDLKRAIVERDYLNQMLVFASNHPSAHVQESAYLLGASFSLTTEVSAEPVSGGAAMSLAAAGSAALSRFDERDMLSEITSDPAESASEIESTAAEPAAIAFYAEREAIMRKYIAGLR